MPTGVHTLPVTVPSGLWSVLGHTHTPLQCHNLRTVSGRFLSLSSFLSKHWLMMGFIELHMVCEAEEGSGLSRESERLPNCGYPTHLSPPVSSSPPSGSGREGHCSYPETLRGEKRRRVRECPPPPPGPMGPSPRILTSDTVGHLSSIMKKAELPST